MPLVSGGLCLAMLMFIPLVLCSLIPRVFAQYASGPVVTITQGKVQGTTSGGINFFRGIPFAADPIGPLRLQQPQSPPKFNGTFQALTSGPACPQQSGQSSATFLAFASLLENISSTTVPETDTQEACLNLDVFVPATATPSSKLPVLFWIYGGGFETGSTTNNNGTTVVQRSIELGEPVIYVAANYRLNAFGFLGSKEIKAAGVGNLGLQDQRAAMRWVRQNVAAFGGDPVKVTIWGESAGAISIGFHLVTNGGNNDGLFRGAVMESGSVLPSVDITQGQPFYDSIVELTGCSGSADTLACLRTVPFQTFLDAVNQTPNIFSFMSLQLAYQPRIDGIFLTENAQTLLAKGQFAKVPLINGDCDDEGTLFSISNANLTTPAEAIRYFQSNYYPKASAAQIAEIAVLYPNAPATGSPFNTGDQNQLTPEFKRIAAFQGDTVFHAPRRNLFSVTTKTQDVFSYLFKRGKATPFLGSFHGSDLVEFYGAPNALGTPPDFQGTDYLLNFANNLNPNTFSHSNNPAAKASTIINWPKYDNTNPGSLLTFSDSEILSVTRDDFRVQPIEFLAALSKELP